jgi:hypothetical protein
VIGVPVHRSPLVGGGGGPLIGSRIAGLDWTHWCCIKIKEAGSMIGTGF